MSAKCQNRLYAGAANVMLFDHLVGPQQD
jgi:hypothetical protein